MSDQSFDQYAKDYDAHLSQALAASGEDKEYFARGRIGWLSRCLSAMKFSARSVLDFGCGTGSAAPYILELLRPQSVKGVDLSQKSLEIAERLHGSNLVKFIALGNYTPDEEIDLVFCNGVMHHVSLDERHETVSFIHKSLRPGGVFALWENNPFNPGTRYIMSRCPFDQDAIMLNTFEARRLLRQAGFEILRTDYLFIFPRILKGLRGLEPSLAKFPLGAQYQILCRKA
jgi:SAM-dependent methyltransferase